MFENAQSRFEGLITEKYKEIKSRLTCQLQEMDRITPLELTLASNIILQVLAANDTILAGELVNLIMSEAKASLQHSPDKVFNDFIRLGWRETFSNEIQNYRTNSLEIHRKKIRNISVFGSKNDKSELILFIQNGIQLILGFILQIFPFLSGLRTKIVKRIENQQTVILEDEAALWQRIASDICRKAHLEMTAFNEAKGSDKNE